MKRTCFILLLMISLVSSAQFNSMSADFIMENNISWIKASYFEEDEHPDYQVFYAFDSTGRLHHSNTSDNVFTEWEYPDSITMIKTTKNPEIGNKIIEISKGWQTRRVIIHNAEGDSIYHKITYDTVKIKGNELIVSFDIVYPKRDTTYRQIYTIDGNLLRYDIYDEKGKVTAYYLYTYVDGRLDYSEYYEGDEFVYKEKITYYEDSDQRKQRVTVAGDDMFSNENTRNVTRYILNEEGLLHQEVEFLGEEIVSTVGYSYEYMADEAERKKR